MEVVRELRSIQTLGIEEVPDTTSFRYVFECSWSHGIITTVRRTYDDLFKFQCKLLDMFPAEAGEGGQRTIPSLPGRNIMSSGVSALAPTKSMKRSLAQSAEEKRLPYIAKYVNDLIKLDKKIACCDLMFSLWDDEFKPAPKPLVEKPGTPQIVCSGFLEKRGQVNKSWKKRFFVLLSNGHMNYYEHERTPDNLRNFLGEIVIDGDTTVDRLVGCKGLPDIAWPKGSDPNSCFWVLTQARTIYFVAPDGAEATRWLRQIRDFWISVLRKTHAANNPQAAPTAASTSTSDAQAAQEDLARQLESVRVAAAASAAEGYDDEEGSDDFDGGSDGDD
eukprot:m.374911 g.374911  ORF g.374911 m.374911 type:complete len:333 (+) comp56172_c0_seq1:58-1056(+)